MFLYIIQLSQPCGSLLSFHKHFSSFVWHLNFSQQQFWSVLYFNILDLVSWRKFTGVSERPTAVTFKEDVDHSETVLKICQATRRHILLPQDVLFHHKVPGLTNGTSPAVAVPVSLHYRKCNWQKIFTWRHTVCCRKWWNMNLKLNCARWNFLLFVGLKLVVCHRAWSVIVPIVSACLVCHCPYRHRA